MKKILWIVSVIFLSALLIYAAGKEKGNASGSLVIGDLTRMNINNIDLPLLNDGSTGNDGQGYYPSGQTSLSFLFSGGFATSGYVNGGLRASWVAHASLLEEWRPGKWGMDPAHPLAKFYEVTSSDGPGNTAYLEWADAVSLGADFIDLDGDGMYDPYVDKPALLGEKTIWTVFNDSTLRSYPGGLGTSPLGLEIQQTTWAYNGPDPLKDVIFFWHRLINTGGETIDSLIYSVWEDPDIGDYTDDLIGCDTTLNLGFIYNHGADAFYGIDPPAFGIRLLQGAAVNSPGDTAYIFHGFGKGIDTLLGMKNLPMTSFMYYIQGGALLPDPRDAQSARHYQEGGVDKDGNPIDPTQWGTGATATTNPEYFYSGDPVTGSGWLDANPMDKRFMVNVGPLNLAPGDTQDVVFTYTIGRGSDALNSITVLRQRASYLDNFFPFGHLLDISVNHSLISTDSTFIFQPLLLNLAFADSIHAVYWVLLERPVGSNAQLTSGPGYQASLDPDVPGDYTIGLRATLSCGEVLADTVTVQAIDNHPPVTFLSVSPSHIQFGASALADASASFDPDGDAIHFDWNFPEWISAASFDTSRLEFTPLHTGSEIVEVLVSDPFFQASATAPFTVTPLINGLSAIDSLKEFNDVLHMQYANGHLYVLRPHSYSLNSLIILDGADLGSQVGGGFLEGERFITDGNIFISYRGSDITLYEIDGNFQLDLQSTIGVTVYYEQDLHLKDQLLFIPAGSELLIYDISDPETPIQISSYPLPLLTRDVVFSDSTAALHSSFPPLNIITLDISDYFNITPLDTLRFLGTQGEIAFSCGKIYVLNGTNDGSQVLVIDAVRPDSLVLADTLRVQSVISGAHSRPIVTLNAISDLLLLGTKDGVKIYDVSDPYQPYERVNRHSGLPVRAMGWFEPYLYAGVQGDSTFGGGLYMLKYDSTFIVSVDEDPIAEIPRSFELFQNYPNPFNPATNIRYHLPIASQVQLTIYNILGQKVRRLVNEPQQPGEHQVRWDGRNEAGVPVASGVYIYRLVVNPPSKQGRGDVQSRKMLLLK